VTSDEWTKVKRLFEEAVDLDQTGRSALLERLDRDDPPAGAQIRMLLKEFDSSDDPPLSEALETMVVDLGVRTPERIGDYRVVRELGRGGAGIVFLAIRETGDSHQAVAIKLLRPSTWDTAQERHFTTERRILARLKHPAIARLLDSGFTSDGLPYLVMEYVDGEPLDSYSNRNTLDIPQRLELFLKVLDAVDLAHRHSIVHRDLKPANILVTARSQVKLLDFGIAKLLEANADITTTLERRFTPAYASPEQINGVPATPATDIYSLGVILYELLTGHTPYDVRTTTLEEISYAILNEKAAPPGSSPRADQVLAKQIGRDLSFITLHALEKDARARYLSVGEFAGHIRRYLAGQPVNRDWTRRPRITRAAWAVAGVFSVLATFIYAQHESPQVARLRLLTPKVLSSDSALSAYPSLSTTGNLLCASDHGGSQVLHLWLRDPSSGVQTQLTSGDWDDTDPAVSPDGQWVAFQSERDPKGIYLMPTLTPMAGKEELVAPFGLSPRFSPDGKWLTFWTKDPRTGFGTAWKLPIDHSREPVRIARGFDDVHNPAWIGDGHYLIVCGTRRSNGGPSEEHDFWVIDRDTDVAFKTGAFEVFARSKIDPHVPYLPATSFQSLPEGLVFTGDQVGKLAIWVLPLDRKTWRASSEPYRLHQSEENEIHASISGNRAAISVARINVGIWVLPIVADSGKVTGKLKQIDLNAGPDLMPSISADGQTLVFLRQTEGKMQPYLWDIAGGARPLPEGSIDGNRLKITGDGRYAFYRAMEGAAGDIQRQAIYRIDLLSGHTDRVCQNCGGPTHASADGKLVLFENGSAITRIAALRVGREERWDLLRHSHHPVGSARFSPDGRWVAFELDQGLDGRQVLVAPFREDELSDRWVAITPEHESAAEPWWSPDGHRLYYLDRRDGFLCIWTRKWNNAAGLPEGDPEPVQHFHGVRTGPLLSVNRTPRYIGLSIARDRLVLTLSEITSEIRLGEFKQ
jgi:serine/threonine protein kinase